MNGIVSSAAGYAKTFASSVVTPLINNRYRIGRDGFLIGAAVFTVVKIWRAYQNILAVLHSHQERLNNQGKWLDNLNDSVYGTWNSNTKEREKATGLKARILVLEERAGLNTPS